MEALGSFANLYRYLGLFILKSGTFPTVNVELKMNITISNDPHEEERDIISSGLQSYNRQYSSGTFEALSVVSRDDENRIIGGLLGVTFGNWLHISDFWVTEEHRRKSIGSDILRAAEKEGIARSCIGVTLDTYSFQSLDFYLKRGYVQFGTLSGYANKFERHYLQKKL